MCISMCGPRAERGVPCIKYPPNVFSYFAQHFTHFMHILFYMFIVNCEDYRGKFYPLCKKKKINNSWKLLLHWIVFRQLIFIVFYFIETFTVPSAYPGTNIFCRNLCSIDVCRNNLIQKHLRIPRSNAAVKVLSFVSFYFIFSTILMSYFILYISE